MKKLFFVLFLLLSMLAQGQEFSFRMYFEDTLGNRDTLTIGFDPNGNRDSILAEFDEENISHIPFDPILDVRITNKVGYAKAEEFLFHTKKKIIYYNCDQQFPWIHPHPYVNIDISASNWPLVASWDSTLFENSCLNGSLFTPWYPRDWWDTGVFYSSPWRTVMKSTSQIEFTPNYPENRVINPENPNYYVDENNNIISTFWLAFGDLSILSLNIGNSINDTRNLVFPNPTKGALYFSDQLLQTNLADITLYDLTGGAYPVKITGNSIDLSRFDNGMYFLKITLPDGEGLTQKILKK